MWCGRFQSSPQSMCWSLNFLSQSEHCSAWKDEVWLRTIKFSWVLVLMIGWKLPVKSSESKCWSSLMMTGSRLSYSLNQFWSSWIMKIIYELLTTWLLILKDHDKMRVLSSLIIKWQNSWIVIDEFYPHVTWRSKCGSLSVSQCLPQLGRVSCSLFSRDNHRI